MMMVRRTERERATQSSQPPSGNFFRPCETQAVCGISRAFVASAPRFLKAWRRWGRTLRRIQTVEHAGRQQVPARTPMHLGVSPAEPNAGRFISNSKLGIHACWRALLGDNLCCVRAWHEFCRRTWCHVSPSRPALLILLSSFL